MIALVLLLGLLLAGCASGGLVGTLPAVPDPSRAASVVIVRPFSVFGSARAPTITVDGADTYDIGPGEHVVIPVAPGERIIGFKLWDLITHRATVVIQAEPGRTYWFITHPGTLIAQITEHEGRELVTKTTPVQENAWQGRKWQDRK